ncbi:MAG: signal peptidase I [Calditrichaeota bacterium]|nr:signal peptidase I [Calditrichota bacterium]
MSEPTQKSQKRFKDFLEGLFVALIAALIIRQFVIQAYTIPTGSMEKTLLIGDFLLVNKFVYGMRTPDWIGIPYTDIGFDVPWVYRFPAIKDPEQYDVIIFRYPKDTSKDYIKRCIAVGGQTVEVINKKVYVDSIAFPVPPHMQHIDRRVFKRDQTAFFSTFRNLGSRDNYGPITIPEDNYWAMGDNRDNSEDSRVWGFVPHDNIVGQALIIYFSWDSDVPWTRFYKKIRFDRMGTVIR